MTMAKSCRPNYPTTNTSNRAERKRELLSKLDELTERIQRGLIRLTELVAITSPDELDRMLAENRSLELRLKSVEQELDGLVTTQKERDRIYRHRKRNI